ncbi:hypothetical protein [Corallococcus sp. EGB]|uniref:hypothetical protein n=1 Tax=Corallococcus sp. EGB TaxID=1521117 RepID=UPI001CBB9F0C|nr:hypothetical protein [Corallococcus sp. EGB]
MSKKVILEAGEWQVSFSALPQQHPTDPYANLAWSVFSFPADFEASMACGNDVARYAFAYKRISKGGQFPPTDGGSPDQILTSPEWERVPITFRCSNMPSIEKLVEGFGQQGEVYTPISSGQRSLAQEAQPLLNDMLQAVADVAVMRVEAQALEVAKERISYQLCGGWVDEHLDQLIPSISGFAAQPALHPVFSQTCSAIHRLTLQDLDNVGNVLRRAMLVDLGQFTAGMLRHRYAACFEPTARLKPECVSFLDAGNITKAYALILAGLATVLVSSQLEAPNLSDAQLLVQQILERLKKTLLDGDTKLTANTGLTQLSQGDAAKVGLVVAAGAIAWCHANGRCDTNAIRNITHDPSRFFTPFSGYSTEQVKALSQMPEYQHLEGKIISLVEQGVEVMAPRKGEDARQAIQRAALLAFDVFDLLLQADCGAGTSTLRCVQLRAKVSSLRSLTVGVLNQDPPTAVLAFAAVLAMELVNQNEADLSRGLRAAGALSSYAASYSNPPDRILSPVERRERRAQAVNALADVAAERVLRVKEFSGSLGVTPGILGLRNVYGDRIYPKYGLQASFPIGLTGHYLLTEELGVFGALNFVDVGQYITTVRKIPDAEDSKEEDPKDKKAEFAPSPFTSLMLGGQIGLQYHGFVLAFDARYAPQLQTDVSSGSIGIQIGYYIPLVHLF